MARLLIAAQGDHAGCVMRVFPDSWVPNRKCNLPRFIIADVDDSDLSAWDPVEPHTITPSRIDPADADLYAALPHRRWVMDFESLPASERQSASTGVPIDCRAAMGPLAWNDIRRAFVDARTGSGSPPSSGRQGRSEAALEAARQGITWESRIAARAGEFMQQLADERTVAIAIGDAHRLESIAREAPRASRAMLLRQAALRKADAEALRAELLTRG